MIKLIPLNERTVCDSILWLNDKEACEFTGHGIFPVSSQDAMEYYRKIRGREVVAWGIFLQDIHIGNVSLSEIDLVNRSAEIAGVMASGYSGNNYMSAGMYFMIEHAFLKMNLNRVWCGTPEKHEAMKRVAVKLGMQPEGRLREAFYYKGEYIDVIRYSILQNEFKETKIQGL